MAQADFSIDKDTLSPGIDQLMPSIQDTVFKIFQYWSTKATSDMRSNAKWTDRTGNARNGLGAAIFDDATSVSLVLYHSVPYGVFLEVRWSGRYAIIGPTMASIVPQLASMVTKALTEMRSRQ